MKTILQISTMLMLAIATIPSAAQFKNTTKSPEHMGINSVYLGSLENKQGENLGYSSYNYISTELSEEHTYQLYINAYGYDQYTSVWIDYNANNKFERNEKVINRAFLSGDGEFTIVPLTIQKINSSALSNRLRIKTEYAYSTSNTIDNPMANPEYGETHDYFIKINKNPFNPDNRKTVAINSTKSALKSN